MTKPPLTILLAAPRGFCAGVERAIQIVEQSIDRFGAPVYVRHEIVHNRTVVEALEAKGAIFVEELTEVPADAPVVFSAHGVPKSVPAEAEARKLTYLDATCPLVSKVHVEAERLYAEGLHIIMIGHAGHPEVIGTLGQLPVGAISLVDSPEDVAALHVPSEDQLAYITQTTLSVDDTAHVVAALKARFPAIRSPHKDDICYATTNRQMAVKAIAADCDVLIVIGAPNSSNSVRLVEVGARAGAPHALRIQHVGELDWASLGTPRRVGITAGASAPEHLVSELVDAFRTRFEVTVEEVRVGEENVKFKLPRLLSA